MDRVIQPILWIVDSGCSKHMTGNLQLLRNFVDKFIGTVRFENDHFAAITGYRDYVQGNLMICHGEDLLIGSRNSNLYTISISNLAASSPLYLMSKATSTKSWLWHQRLSHLNFGTINHLTKKDLVDGLPKFKYDKDHLCSACKQGNSKKASFLPKLVPSTESKLELLHMDLCRPMRVESISGKRYILVTIDDYSCYTWTPKFLWAEAIATACFTRNHSLVHTRKRISHKRTKNKAKNDKTEHGMERTSSVYGTSSRTRDNVDSTILTSTRLGICSKAEMVVLLFLFILLSTGLSGSTRVLCSDYDRQTFGLSHVGISDSIVHCLSGSDISDGDLGVRHYCNTEGLDKVSIEYDLCFLLVDGFKGDNLWTICDDRSHSSLVYNIVSYKGG
ncbi:retrovirus-related pol polyprotein from transposon TNT 1-94 [Tanacetum coccineum]